MATFLPFDPIFVAYASLGIMAVLPIYIGSFESIPDPSVKKERETMRKEDAYWFPVIGSVVLFSFYLLFTFFSKEIVNVLITAYFSIFGTLALVQITSPAIRSILHAITGYSCEQPKDDAKKEEEEEKLSPQLVSWLDLIFAPTKMELCRHGSGRTYILWTLSLKWKLSVLLIANF